ncbi:MAG: RsmD family RNA methyltransferase [Planctomycetes bacterium]|nr:RsmD family RNA methyltransferase [Planctomycetota bacterium]
MAKKKAANPKKAGTAGKPSALLDTRVIYCGDNLEQLKKLPENSVDLIYIDPPFNSNRNYEVFWGETKEKRAFKDRHASTQAYIEFMRPRCVDSDSSENELVFNRTATLRDKWKKINQKQSK